MNINQGYGISVSCKNPDVVVSFLNTMMSEEWQKIFNWGIEGEDYLVDENGRYYRTPEMREQQKDLVWRSKNRLEALYDICRNIRVHIPTVMPMARATSLKNSSNH